MFRFPIRDVLWLSIPRQAGLFRARVERGHGMASYDLRGH